MSLHPSLTRELAAWTQCLQAGPLSLPRRDPDSKAARTWHRQALVLTRCDRRSEAPCELYASGTHGTGSYAPHSPPLAVAPARPKSNGTSTYALVFNSLHQQTQAPLITKSTVRGKASSRGESGGSLVPQRYSERHGELTGQKGRGQPRGPPQARRDNSHTRKSKDGHG